VQLTTHVHLVRRLRTCGAMPPPHARFISRLSRNKMFVYNLQQFQCSET
jgi:hypothetical protein